MTFKLLVLRFMALLLRLHIVGEFTREQCEDLVADIETSIKMEGWSADGRTLPAGIETKHGQAAIDVEENGD